MSITLQARVEQKTDTLANWMVNPLVLLKGEQAFVQSEVDDALIIFKVGNGVDVFADLPWPDYTVRGVVDTTTVFTGLPSGVYLPSEDGVYGPVTVTLSDGYQVLYWDGSALVKAVFSLPVPTVTDGSITTAKLADLAVTSAKLVDGSVTPYKTTIFQTGKNLFNLATATAGFFVNPANGTLSANAGYYASDFIPVSASTAYARTNQYQLAYYNSSKTYISGLSTFAGTPDTFTTPASTAFVRVSMLTANVPTYQLELGASVTAYASYTYTINPVWLGSVTPGIGTIQSDRLQTGSVTPNKMTIMAPGTNKFNLPDVTTGSYVNGLTGLLAANASYSASAYIPVLPSTAYARTNQYNMAFYDINRNFISGSTATAGTADTFTTPANCYFVRLSVLNTKLTTFQFQTGAVVTAYEAYAITIGSQYIPAIGVTDGAVTSSKLATAAVTPTKTSFVALGKNIYNSVASDIVLGSYINYATGATAVNASYNASGYMAVLPSTTYAISFLTHLAWYDANRVYINGVTTAGVAGGTAVSPVNAAYLRVSVKLSNATNFQVEANSTATAYEAYHYTLLSNDGVPFSLSQYISFVPYVEIDLNSIIYATVGVERNIYFDSLIIAGLPLSNFDIDITCSKGQQFQDFYRVTPTSTDTGTFTFTVNVLYNGVSVTSATGSLIIGAAVTSATRKVLYISDSTGTGGQVLSPILNDYSGNGYNVTFIGTQGTGSAKHEAYSGWKSSDFATAGRILYKFNLSGVSVAPGVGSVYSNNSSQFTVSEVNLSSGSGYINCTRSSGSNPPTLTASTLVFVSGSGDATLSYTSAVVGSGNPFWNSGFDFANYLTTNSFTMSASDLVVIHLGINDMFGATDDATAATAAATFITNIDIIINGMLAAVSGLRFGICLTIPPSKSQDAFAVSYGTGQTLKRYERNRHILIKALLAYYDNSTKRAAGIYLVGYHACTDRTNNYQFASAAAVNARNTGTTIVRQNNGVHPATSGYYQMGDVLYTFLKNLN